MILPDHCPKHGEHQLLLDQHSERLTIMEGMAIENSNDNNNIEGRVTAFTYVIGLAFLLMVSLSYAGLSKIIAYKEVAAEQTLKYTNILNELKTSVEVASERSADVKNSQIALTNSVNAISVDHQVIKFELIEVEKRLIEVESIKHTPVIME